MFGLKTWRRQRILKRAKLPEALWREVLNAIPMLRGLSPDEQRRLCDLVTLFLYEKDFSGAGGLEITDTMRLQIAAQACLVILNLGIDYYKGWVSVIIYPYSFRPRQEYTDEYGIVHEDRGVLSGESWLAGPVILAWHEAQQCAYNEASGTNLVIHEFAHKLDMLNGAANGMPPLHKEINRRDWTEDFSAAYKAFCRQLDRGEMTVVDPYAAENPAEFFAVMSEGFFVVPEKVKQAFPKVYAQLKAFYRQDPSESLRLWAAGRKLAPDPNLQMAQP